jgi:hypothetical protein
VLFVLFVVDVVEKLRRSRSGRRAGSIGGSSLKVGRTAPPGKGWATWWWWCVSRRRRAVALMMVELDAEEELESVYDTNPEAAVQPWERTTPLEATADVTLSVDTEDTEVAAVCDTRELVEDSEEAYCVTLEMEVEMDASERAEVPPREDERNANELEDTEEIKRSARGVFTRFPVLPPGMTIS